MICLSKITCTQSSALQRRLFMRYEYYVVTAWTMLPYRQCSDRSSMVAKLQYASCAWWGFSTVADRQRIIAFIRRSARCGFVPADLPEFDEMCRSADETLFRNIISNHNHVLFGLLPPPSTASQNYNLRRRFHNLQIPARVNYLNDCNFINRMLYANLY